MSMNHSRRSSLKRHLELSRPTASTWPCRAVVELQSGEAVAVALGAGQIAGQCGGVARHHHDALRASEQDLVDHGPRTLARRIEYGDVEERVARMKVLRSPFANVGR